MNNKLPKIEKICQKTGLTLETFKDYAMNTTDLLQGAGSNENPFDPSIPSTSGIPCHQHPKRSCYETRKSCIVAYILTL